jgi:hypothetical protein
LWVLQLLNSKFYFPLVSKETTHCSLLKLPLKEELIGCEDKRENIIIGHLIPAGTRLTKLSPLFLKKEKITVKPSLRAGKVGNVSQRPRQDFSNV